MAKKVLVLIGTKKGAFILESGAERRSWQLRGPFCETWPMNHVIADPATGTIYGGGGNEWFGPAVGKSTDLGATWTHSSDGLGVPGGRGPDQVGLEPGPGCRQVFTRASSRPGCSAAMMAASHGSMSPDFESTPRGRIGNPGGGGLILHSLLPHPTTRTSYGSAFRPRGRTLLHGSASGRSDPMPSSGSCDADVFRASKLQHAVQDARTAMATSVVCRPSVRERSASPITRL